MKQRSTTTTAATAPPVPGSLRIKTPIDAWGEGEGEGEGVWWDDHTKRSARTAATQDTAASSAAASASAPSEDGSVPKGKRISASSSSSSSPRANLLMKLLAKEMAAALLREGSTGGLDNDILGLIHKHHAQPTKGIRRQASADDDSEYDDEEFDEDDDASDDESAQAATKRGDIVASANVDSLESEEFDVESVVQMVVASVEKQKQRAEGHLHGLSAGAAAKTSPTRRTSMSSPAASRRRAASKSQPSPRKQLSPRKSSSAAGDALSGGRSSHTVQTKTSELSLGSATNGSRKSAQMDIWHPDFWAVQEGAPAEAASSADNGKARMPAPAAVVIEDLRPVEKPGRDDEVLVNADEGEDDEVDDDDISLLSDISGLTDAWNLEGVRNKKKNEAPRGGVVISPKKIGLASMLFGGSNHSSKKKNKANGDAGTKSSHTDASSLIGSHVGTADNRSVSTRRSKSSMSSGGGGGGHGSSNSNKINSNAKAKHPTTPSTKSTSSSGASSRRSQGLGSRSSPPARTVSFSTVHVREYERILCDNPAASSGLSVGIGWKFVDLTTNNKEEDDDDANNTSDVKPAAITVDDWQLRKKRGRSQSELILSRREREIIVKQWGHTEREIAAMKRELNRCRSQRRQTVNNLGAQKVEEAVETVRSKVKSLLFLQARDERAAATLVSI